MINKWINYVSMVLLVAFGLIFYHHYALMIMFVFMLIAPAVSYVVTRRNIDKFSIKVDAKKSSVGKKIPVDICFHVKNQSLIPLEGVKVQMSLCNCFYENDEEYELIIPAIPKKTRIATISVNGIYCGRMIAKIEKVTIYDIFGLFQFKKEVNSAAEIYIMPSKSSKFENVQLSVLGVTDDEELQMKKGDDVSQISEIRNYIPGDKLQNIHWKLSAKNDELQVKEFSLPYSEEVIVLVELYVDKENPFIFDKLLENLYAFSRDLLKQGRKFKLVWKDNDYELKTVEVYNDDNLNTGIREIYFANVQKMNGTTYHLYTSINPEMKGTVLYMSDRNVDIKGGTKLDIGDEGVMMTCLN